VAVRRSANGGPPCGSGSGSGGHSWCSLPFTWLLMDNAILMDGLTTPLTAVVFMSLCDLSCLRMIQWGALAGVALWRRQHESPGCFTRAPSGFLLIVIIFTVRSLGSRLVVVWGTGVLQQLGLGHVGTPHVLFARRRRLTTKSRRVLAWAVVLLRDDGRGLAALPIRLASRERRPLLSLVRLSRRSIVVGLLPRRHVRGDRGGVLHVRHVLHVLVGGVGGGRPTLLLRRALVGGGHARHPVGCPRFASDGGGPTCGHRRATRPVWHDDGRSLCVLGGRAVVCRRRGRVVRVGV
jgi:hypothetical protein